MATNYYDILQDTQLYNEVETLDASSSPVVHVGSINDINGRTGNIASALVKMGSKCLNFVAANSRFESKYRIEFSPDPNKEGNWKFSLRLDPVAWFDECVSTYGLEDTVTKARAYVTSIRSGHQPPARIQSNYKPILSNVY